MLETVTMHVHLRSKLTWPILLSSSYSSSVGKTLFSLTEFFAFFHRLRLPLPQRLEYLTLAVANAKSSGSSAIVSVEFVTDLEEKIEVAQVQIEVLRAVMASRNIQEELKVELAKELNSGLLTISEVGCHFILFLFLNKDPF